MRVHQDGDGRRPTVLGTVTDIGRVLIVVTTDDGGKVWASDDEVYDLEETDR